VKRFVKQSISSSARQAAKQQPERVYTSCKKLLLVALNEGTEIEKKKNRIDLKFLAYQHGLITHQLVSHWRWRY
jgi:hypothetical protein